MPTSQRTLLFGLICAFCIIVSVGYVWVRARQTGAAELAAATGEPRETAAALPSSPYVLFRGGDISAGYGQIVAVPLDNLAAPRVPAALRCERVDFAAGRGICLTADRGAITSYYAVLFGADLQAAQRLPLQGIPSRTRLSPDGRYVAVTVFVSGHSYAPGSFSTRTDIYSAADGGLVGELESFAVERDGKPFKAIDFNFWGVSFANDGDRFYATLATGGQNYLIEGSVATKSARIIYSGVECPSLSPDGGRVAFKRLQADGWRLYVLDLASGVAQPLVEARSVDDQVEWLDDARVLYAVSDDVWVAQADGTGEPAVFLANASSPAIVR